MSRLRVLHIQKVKGLGGSENHLRTLLPAFARRGVDVRMLVLASGDWRRFTDLLQAEHVPFDIAPAGPDLDPRPSRAISRAITSFGPDLVHTHLIHATVHGQLAARRASVPAVTTAHNIDPRIRRFPVLQVARRTGRNAARTIAISEHVQEYLEELRIPRPGTVRVVPYGIDVEGRRLDPDARAAARKGFGLADDDVTVAVVARLIDGKGHGTLLEALRTAHAVAPRLRLLVAGDGPLRSSLEERAASFPEGVVRFLGFLDDPRDLIGASDILAFPTESSMGEGFGLSALEAMAAGIPVIASDAGALPELVLDGETGIIVPDGAEDGLASALVRLAGDPSERVRLGEAGLARARERYSVMAMVDGTLSVYGEALRRPASIERPPPR
ncbi:MAG: glycosyltransferase family 4 protein [Actinomycetota bacterium]